MRHRQVEAFRAVMIAGTITAAGRMLRISQPSVSRLIADFERQIGLDLFRSLETVSHPGGVRVRVTVPERVPPTAG